MSTAFQNLTKEEIAKAFSSSYASAFPPFLTTAEAANLLRVKPKTLNAWKNRGQLEGTYRQRNGEDRYVRDRLIEKFFNGLDWKNDQKTEQE